MKILLPAFFVLSVLAFVVDPQGRAAWSLKVAIKINLFTVVLKECLNLFKPSGELYFSGVHANRRVPQTLQDNEVLWGECLSGALYWNDFEKYGPQRWLQRPWVGRRCSH
jgi:hypothetical protein